MSDDRIDALAQRLFQAAREERPDAVLQERVRELGSAARASSVAPPASGARAATRQRRRVAPWLAAAGALSAAAALWLLVGERTLRHDAEVLISAETRPPAAERLPAPSAPAVVPALAPPSAAREPSVEPPPVASAPLAPSRAVVPHASTPSQRAATPRAVVQPSQPGESKRSVPLRQQLELLQQARSLLRSGQPKEALVALDRYESELGGTDLRDEAALLRIEALAAQGRAAEAAALARRFVLEHPDSPLAERAQRLGAGH